MREFYIISQADAAFILIFSPLYGTHSNHLLLQLKSLGFIAQTTAASVTADPSPPPTSSRNSLKLNSAPLIEPKSQSASQAVLHLLGLSDSDMDKPQIGISSIWYEEAGIVGLRFSTIGVSDAISIGTRGMCFSLQGRELIADSNETVMIAQWYDINISIPGFDKNMPGTIMAIGLNRPAIMVYGGTIKPGHFQGHTYDIVSALQVYGEYFSGFYTKGDPVHFQNTKYIKLSKGGRVENVRPGSIRRSRGRRDKDKDGNGDDNRRPSDSHVLSLILGIIIILMLFLILFSLIVWLMG